MATDNKDNKLSIGGVDYAEILRQRVAVIGHDKKLLRSVALSLQIIAICWGI